MAYFDQCLIPLWVVLFAGCSAEKSGETANTSAPRIVLESRYELDEEVLFETTIDAADPDGDLVRLYVFGLPPGAHWSPESRRLHFRPDFIQGGTEWTLNVLATDGVHTTQASTVIHVNNTIQPPEPILVSQEDKGSYIGLTFDQVTDDFLDSPGYAGRTFTARIQVPTAATESDPMPVRVSLHGLGGSASSTGASNEFRIRPHDPMNTYWWGYSDSLPNGQTNAGVVHNYTQRRVLHLLEWLLDNYPAADKRRVYVSGSSMGGAGALKLGYLYGRHFAWVDSTIGQTIARNHRPYRITTLDDFWGTPQDDLVDSTGFPVWDQLDMTRALLENPEARNQAVRTKHGKDDATIHFGAVVQASPLTGFSFFEVLQHEAIGHYVIWDEGGHGSSDPVLGSSWWDNGWSPIADPITYYRSNTAFPAFSNASVDNNPGDGEGNGNQSWDDSAGYAGMVSVAGDTGWNGDIAGTRNRFLRWDTNDITDSFEEFGISLWVLNGAGDAATLQGYPTSGDQLDGELPVRVDVTLRRVQNFQLVPDELVYWRFDDASGAVNANLDGSVTVPNLPINLTQRRLVLTRSLYDDPP